MTQNEIESAMNAQYTKIANLRNELAQTDYIVIRAKEQGLTLTADFKAERQGWRDEINAAEAEIERLKGLKSEVEIEPITE